MSKSLLEAARDGDTETIRARRNLDWSDKGRFGETALMLAVVNGHAETVRLLLERGADVREQDENGNTALHYAAQTGHTEIARVLLVMGAEVDATNWFEMDADTPLNLATRGGHIETVDLLLKHGADVPYGAVLDAVNRGDKDMTLLLTIVREQRWLAKTQL